jgi:hypothetical protein
MDPPVKDDIHALISALGKARATTAALRLAKWNLEEQLNAAKMREEDAQQALHISINGQISAENPSLLPHAPVFAQQAERKL